MLGLILKSAVVILGCLCWFKYANLLVHTANDALQAMALSPFQWTNVILPIALSFTVLQSVSYLIDVRRRTVVAEPSARVLERRCRVGPGLELELVERGRRRCDPNADDHVARRRERFPYLEMNIFVADRLFREQAITQIIECHFLVADESDAAAIRGTPVRR